MRLKSSNRWKFLAVLFPIIGTLCHAQPMPGGQSAFAAAWAGYKIVDPYLLLKPTAYWHPSKTRDTKDLVLDLVATNTANQPTISANGWEFNGTSQFLDMGRPTALEPGTNRQYSMSVWVYAYTTNTVRRNIIGKQRATQTHDMWGITANPASTPRGFAVWLSENAGGNTYPGFDYQSNTWYHLTFTLNRSVPSNLLFYVDGVLYHTANFTDVDPITYDGGADAPFRIGAGYGADLGPLNYWNGNVDRAAVWNGTALTSNEVYNLFEQSREGKK